MFKIDLKDLKQTSKSKRNKNIFVIKIIFIKKV